MKDFFNALLIFFLFGILLGFFAGKNEVNNEIEIENNTLELIKLNSIENRYYLSYCNNNDTIYVYDVDNRRLIKGNYAQLSVENNKKSTINWFNDAISDGAATVIFGSAYDALKGEKSKISVLIAKTVGFISGYYIGKYIGKMIFSTTKFTKEIQILLQNKILWEKATYYIADKNIKQIQNELAGIKTNENTKVIKDTLNLLQLKCLNNDIINSKDFTIIFQIKKSLMYQIKNKNIIDGVLNK